MDFLPWQTFSATKGSSADERFPARYETFRAPGCRHPPVAGGCRPAGNRPVSKTAPDPVLVPRHQGLGLCLVACKLQQDNEHDFEIPPLAPASDLQSNS